MGYKIIGFLLVSYVLTCLLTLTIIGIIFDCMNNSLVFLPPMSDRFELLDCFRFDVCVCLCAQIFVSSLKVDKTNLNCFHKPNVLYSGDFVSAGKCTNGVECWLYISYSLSTHVQTKFITYTKALLLNTHTRFTLHMCDVSENTPVALPGYKLYSRIE